MHLLLEALQYPHAQSFDGSEQQARQLIVFLENQKIRHLKPADRSGLNSTSSANWDEELSKYLEGVECPITYTPGSNLQEVLGWLLRYAVHLEFSDNADELLDEDEPEIQPTVASQAKASEARAEASGRTAAGTASSYSDLSLPEVQRQLRALLDAAHVDSAGMTPLQMAQALRRVVEEQVVPATQLLGPQPASQPQRGRDALDKLTDELPLGFDAPDPTVGHASKLLRMLYLGDLRLLQDEADRAIVEVQEWTANPRTNSSLGKVGR